MNPADFASIRLVREGPAGAPEHDDRIRIYPLKGAGQKGLKIKYYDGDLKDTHRSTFTGVTLYDYVLALLKGVTTEDCEQFKNVQFNFPGFPTLMYSMEAVGDKFVRSNILDITEMIWSGWELAKAEAEAAAAAAQASDEEMLCDDDSCSEEEGGEEDSQDTDNSDEPVGGVAALEEQLDDEEHEDNESDDSSYA